MAPRTQSGVCSLEQARMKEPQLQEGMPDARRVVYFHLNTAQDRNSTSASEMRAVGAHGEEQLGGAGGEGIHV